MKVLITGSSGFIGKVFVGRLANAHTLICPSREHLKLNETSLPLYLLAVENKIDALVHLAHPRVYTIPPSMGEAVGMMRNILDVCRMLKIPVLYLSSLVVFSGHSAQEPISPSLEPSPRGTYPETKFLCEKLANLYERNYGLDVTILRPSYVYGVGLEGVRIVSKLILRAVRDEQIVIHKYLNGFQVFDFMYVDDLVDALVIAMNKPQPKPLNLGTGRGVSTYGLAKMVVDMTGSKSKIHTLEINDVVPYYVPDVRQSESMLGWKARTSLEQGLASVVSSIQGEAAHRGSG